MGRSSVFYEGSSHGCHTRKCVHNKTPRFGQNTLTAHSTLLFLHSSSLLEFEHICFGCTVFQISTVCLRRTDIVDTLWSVMCYLSLIAAAVLGKKSRCVSIPLSSTAHLAHSVFGGYRRHTLVTSCEPTYNPMIRRKKVMRSCQATRIAPGGILSRSIMSSSLPSTSFVMISWKPRIRHLCKLNLLAGGNPVQLHVDHEDIKTFSWEWNHKNWASEE